MADGDIVHEKIPRHYQQVYQQIMQNHYTPQQLAHNVLTPLRQDFRAYGNDILKFLVDAGKEIDAGAGPLLRPFVDCDALKQSIERKARLLVGNRYAIQLAADACERYINALPSREGDIEAVPELVTMYLMEIYNAQFDSYARTPSQKQQVDQILMLETLDAMYPYVEEYAAMLAEQAIRHGDTSMVKLPSSPQYAPVTLDEDLLSPGP